MKLPSREEISEAMKVYGDSKNVCVAMFQDIARAYAECKLVEPMSEQELDEVLPEPDDRYDDRYKTGYRVCKLLAKQALGKPEAKEVDATGKTGGKA